VEPFDRVVPTVENIAIDIWNRIDPHIGGGAKLYSVRVHETAELSAEYRGEK
jgi:6-pyruvoyl-tetrahydropterin synthase